MIFCYKLITSLRSFIITRYDLGSFLKENGLNLTGYELDLLFWYIDKDCDGCINWDEFQKILKANQHHHTNYLEKCQQASIDLRHSLMRVFEQEVINQTILENSRKELRSNSATESVLFNLLDRGFKGWINLSDIKTFMRKKYKDISDEKINHTLKRMDQD